MPNVPFSSQELLKWSGAIFVTLLEAYVVYAIARKWDMRRLICAENGDASMSRFQLLLFTFAIGGGYFYLMLQKAAFPPIDVGALGLLGISSGTYAISKGIQASRDTNAAAQASATTNPPAVPTGGSLSSSAAAGAGGPTAPPRQP